MSHQPVLLALNYKQTNFVSLGSLIVPIQPQHILTSKFYFRNISQIDSHIFYDGKKDERNSKWWNAVYFILAFDTNDCAYIGTECFEHKQKTHQLCHKFSNNRQNHSFSRLIKLNATLVDGILNEQIIFYSFSFSLSRSNNINFRFVNKIMAMNLRNGKNLFSPIGSMMPLMLLRAPAFWCVQVISWQSKDFPRTLNQLIPWSHYELQTISHLRLNCKWIWLWNYVNDIVISKHINTYTHILFPIIHLAIIIVQFCHLSPIQLFSKILLHLFMCTPVHNIYGRTTNLHRQKVSPCDIVSNKIEDTFFARQLN